MEVTGVQSAAPAAAAADGTGQAAAWKVKLNDGAKQFEAMLLEQMMKPLQFGTAPGAAGPDDADKDKDDSSDAASDVIRSFGTEALARAVVAGGGFGIAKQILRQVTAEHDAQTVNRAGTKVS